MKTRITRIFALILALLCSVCLASCDNGAEVDLWESATYSSDATIGDGTKSVTITVEAQDKSVNLTLKTDKDMLGDAMFEVGLINDASFFDTLNGIQADWNADQAYWGFYLGYEFLSVGVNDTPISDGDHYRFVYTK